MRARFNAATFAVDFGIIMGCWIAGTGIGLLMHNWYEGNRIGALIGVALAGHVLYMRGQRRSQDA